MKAMVRQKILERRNKARVDAKMRIRIANEYEEVKIYHGNISKSGIYVETNDVFGDLGDKVHLELLTETSEQPIKLRGQVVRVTKPNQVGAAQGMAIQFLRVDQKYIKMLEQYIGELFDGKGTGCRKSPRVTSHVLVEVKNNDATYGAIADNMGHGGVFLKMSAAELAIGDLIQLAITHPSSRRRFFVEAEVVHIRSGNFDPNPEFVEGVGVQFINLSEQRRKDMVSFLKSILQYQRRTSSQD